MPFEIKPLFERCHVNTNEDGDTFVGVKADTDDIVVYFPLGYNLPSDEESIRREIIFLFRILSQFTIKEDRLVHMKKNEAPQTVNFPIRAYLEIIEYYLDNDYYYEKETQYEVSNKGKTNWSKTIKTQMPLVDNRGFFYTNRVVRTSNYKENNFITELNKYCVYESFSKLGWLYGSKLPQKPTFELEGNTKMALSILDSKIFQTNEEKTKRLFQAMKAMIKFIDEKTLDRQFYFGTNRFEYVWEAMIDKVFGIKNKQQFFPRAKWKIRYGDFSEHSKHPLEPDTIMVYGDKFYVLDAKYYQFGRTAMFDDLPNSADINKQITYGEYLYTNSKLKNENLFNAFIMPFNAKDNYFEIDKSNICINAAEATGDWRPKSAEDTSSSLLNFEKIQGIVIDVKYLMYHLEGNHDTEKQLVAEQIENGIKGKTLTK